jgi:hypothetical integral membrane protein (TIGR02206 family)
MLTPADASMYDIPHYRIMQTLIAHGLLIAIPIYMTVVEGYRPTLASFKRIFIWTNIYMVVIFFLNRAIGSNYLFIAKSRLPHPAGCAFALALVHPAIGSSWHSPSCSCYTFHF